MEEPDHRARELIPGVDAVGALDVERADAVAFGLLGDPRELAAARLTDVPDPHTLPPKRLWDLPPPEAVPEKATAATRSAASRASGAVRARETRRRGSIVAQGRLPVGLRLVVGARISP